jgi:16S rRNA (uracil1498-N3)-methyltransferase
LHRLFVDASIKPAARLDLSVAASHYLLRVLRLEADAEVELFNGDGYNYTAALLSAQGKLAAVQIRQRSAGPKVQIPATHLAVALLKGERMDYALQKATELGVSRIFLTQCSRSEAKLRPQRLPNRLAHWTRVIQSACEQSGRTRVPQLHPPHPLADVLAQTQSMCCYCLDPLGTAGQMQIDTRELCLFTGPEGGFDDSERALLQAQCTLLKFGDLILRAETAPIVGLTLVQGARELR